jgi:hypothetical protein
MRERRREHGPLGAAATTSADATSTVAATTTFCAVAFAGGCTTALTILTSCVTESEKGITIDNEAAYFFQFVHARLNSTGR